MAFKYVRRAALAASMLQVVSAQQSNIVPEDMRAGFTKSGKEVQVSYTGEAVNGFKDGTVFEKDAVAQEPTFALGDSSGISPTILYTLIMVDTTCPNARKLHYARPNFKYNFDITNIETESQALLEYKAPGSLGETGDNRQYSFLMYTNPQRRQIDQLQLPGDDENFDIQKFQEDNGLEDATAGVGMVVKLGGEANCEGGDSNPLPSSDLPTPQPPRTTSARASATGGGSGGATSVAASSAAVSSAVSSQPSDDDEQAVSSQSAPGGGVSDVTLATSVLATPTVVLTSGQQPNPAGATGSTSLTGLPAEQTDNAASGVFAGSYQLAGPLVVAAGLLAW